MGYPSGISGFQRGNLIHVCLSCTIRRKCCRIGCCCLALLRSFCRRFIMGGIGYAGCPPQCPCHDPSIQRTKDTAFQTQPSIKATSWRRDYRRIHLWISCQRTVTRRAASASSNSSPPSQSFLSGKKRAIYPFNHRQRNTKPHREFGRTVEQRV